MTILGVLMLALGGNVACEHYGKYVDCMHLRTKEHGEAYLAPHDLAGVTSFSSNGQLNAAVQDGQFRVWGPSLFRPPPLDAVRPGILAATFSGYFCAIVAHRIQCYQPSGQPHGSPLALTEPRKIVSGMSGGELCAIGDEGVRCWGKGALPIYDKPHAPADLKDPVDLFAGFVHHDNLVDSEPYQSAICALDEGSLKCWKGDQALPSPLGAASGFAKVFQGYGAAFCAHSADDGKAHCSTPTGDKRYTVAIDSIKEFRASPWVGSCAITDEGKIGCWSYDSYSKEPVEPKWIDMTEYQKRFPEMPVATTRGSWSDPECKLYASGRWKCSGQYAHFEPDDFRTPQALVFGPQTLTVAETDKISFHSGGKVESQGLVARPWRLLASRMAGTYCFIDNRCTFAEFAYVFDAGGLQGIAPWSKDKTFKLELPPAFLTKLKRPRKLRILERMARVVCVLEDEHLECVNRTSKKTVLTLEGVRDFDGEWPYVLHKPDDKTYNDSHLCAATRKEGVRCFVFQSAWDGKSESVRETKPFPDLEADAVAMDAEAKVLVSARGGYHYLDTYYAKVGENVGPPIDARLLAVADLPRVLSKAARLVSDNDAPYLNLAVELGERRARFLAGALAPYLESKYLAHWTGACMQAVAAKLKAFGAADLGGVALDEPTARAAIRLVPEAWRGREALFSDPEKKSLADLARAIATADAAGFRAAVKAHPEWAKLLAGLANRPIVGPRMVVSARILDWVGRL